MSMSTSIKVGNFNENDELAYIAFNKKKVGQERNNYVMLNPLNCGKTGSYFSRNQLLSGDKMVC